MVATGLPSISTRVAPAGTPLRWPCAAASTTITSPPTKRALIGTVAGPTFTRERGSPACLDGGTIPRWGLLELGEHLVHHHVGLVPILGVDELLAVLQSQGRPVLARQGRVEMLGVDRAPGVVEGRGVRRLGQRRQRLQIEVRPVTALVLGRGLGRCLRRRGGLGIRRRRRRGVGLVASTEGQGGEKDRLPHRGDCGTQCSR